MCDLNTQASTDRRFRPRNNPRPSPSGPYLTTTTVTPTHPPHSHTPTLPHSHTPTLLHSHTPTLPHSHTPTLPHVILAPSSPSVLVASTEYRHRQLGVYHALSLSGVDEWVNAGMYLSRPAPPHIWLRRCSGREIALDWTTELH